MLRSLFGWLICAVCLSVTVIAGGASSHRYHTSLTRIDYNADEKLAEITVQIFTGDFETALTQMTDGKKPVHLDKTPQIDKLILNYLAERFVIKNKSGENRELRWVGLKAENDVALLYVETPMPEGFDGATLENSLLNDLFADQVNLVTARANDLKNDLVFRTNDAAQLLIKKVEPTNSNN